MMLVLLAWGLYSENHWSRSWKPEKIKGRHIEGQVIPNYEVLFDRISHLT